MSKVKVGTNQGLSQGWDTPVKLVLPLQATDPGQAWGGLKQGSLENRAGKEGSHRESHAACRAPGSLQLRPRPPGTPFSHGTRGPQPLSSEPQGETGAPDWQRGIWGQHWTLTNCSILLLSCVFVRLLESRATDSSWYRL